MTRENSLIFSQWRGLYELLFENSSEKKRELITNKSKRRVHYRSIRLFLKATWDESSASLQKNLGGKTHCSSRSLDTVLIKKKTFSSFDDRRVNFIRWSDIIIFGKLFQGVYQGRAIAYNYRKSKLEISLSLSLLSTSQKRGKDLSLRLTATLRVRLRTMYTYCISVHGSIRLGWIWIALGDISRQEGETLLPVGLSCVEVKIWMESRTNGRERFCRLVTVA